MDVKNLPESGHSSFVHIGLQDSCDKTKSVSSSYLDVNNKNASTRPSSGKSNSVSSSYLNVNFMNALVDHLSDKTNSVSSSYLAVACNDFKNVKSTVQSAHRAHDEAHLKGDHVHLTASENKIDFCTACSTIYRKQVNATYFCNDCGQRRMYLCQRCIRQHDFYLQNHNLQSQSLDFCSKSREVPPTNDTISIDTLDEIYTESEQLSPRTVISEQPVKMLNSISSESDKSILIRPSLNVRQFVKKFEALTQTRSEQNKTCDKLDPKASNSLDDLKVQKSKVTNQILTEEDNFSGSEYQSLLKSDIKWNKDWQKKKREQRISKRRKNNSQYRKLDQLFVQPLVNGNRNEKKELLSEDSINPNMKTVIVNKDQHISAICQLNSGLLILADDGRDILQILDPDTYDETDSLALTNTPCDICALSSCEVIVSFPGIYLVQIISISDSIKVDRSEILGHVPYGLSVFEMHVYIGTNKGTIVMYDNMLVKLQTICCQGTIYSKYLDKITVNENLILIAYGESGVVAINRNGEYMWCYKESSTINIESVCFDATGNILACDRRSGSILKLSPKGVLQKTIIEKLNSPEVVFVNKKNNALIISSFRQNCFYVLDIQD